MERIFCALVVFFSLVDCQTVSNVQLVDYRGYFQKFSNEFAKILEQKEWCSLTLPDMEHEINATVYTQQVLGTVKYTNGFVASMGSIDILESSMMQRFLSPSASQATVQVAGTIRMVNVVVGFDAEAKINEKKRHYTGVSKYDLIHNEFVILKDLFTNEIVVTCKTVVQRSPSKMSFLPSDETTDIMTSTYVVTSTNPAIVEWAKVFQPIAQEVATNIVPFPDICYNCPAA